MRTRLVALLLIAVFTSASLVQAAVAPRSSAAKADHRDAITGGAGNDDADSGTTTMAKKKKKKKKSGGSR
jgi:hypothetical protein